MRCGFPLGVPCGPCVFYSLCAVLLCVLLLCAVALSTFGENAKYVRYFAIALRPTAQKKREQREELEI